MPTRTIRVDDQTHRAITDLAYLLDTTRSYLVADAIAEYAQRRGSVVRIDGRVTFDELPVAERLMLRRDELIRVFAKREATDVRILHLGDDGTDGVARDDGVIDDEIDDETPWMPPRPLELLVTTALHRGGGESYELERIAAKLLRTRVHVESATRLELFDRPALERARANSTPLSEWTRGVEPGSSRS
ncbi:hypothetical protein [Agromyces lapidis]|uniref:Ribbon-helix-helix protein, CopG family n=1 Tax=Agromyces lapidis TaxID=279574 RepID=A0ABV5SLP9_9MICO|nr:hypothetical protein [Agromyces lapidis]